MHEPYIEIWCQTAYHYELLDLDNEGKYVLQTYLDEFLVDKNNLKNMGARFHLFTNIVGERLRNYPSKIDDFRNNDYGLGVMDQFMETTLGIKHLTAKEQEEMFAKIGFKDLERTSMQGIDIITALK